MKSFTILVGFLLIFLSKEIDGKVREKIFLKSKTFIHFSFQHRSNFFMRTWRTLLTKNTQFPRWQPLVRSIRERFLARKHRKQRLTLKPTWTLLRCILESVKCQRMKLSLRKMWTFAMLTNNLWWEFCLNIITKQWRKELTSRSVVLVSR